jgi:hypothetical protein
LRSRVVERRELVAELLHRRVVAARIVGKAEAPDLIALLLAELAEGLVEARDQVALRHHHVDRRTHAEMGVQLLQAQAQLGRVLLAVGRCLLQQVLDVHRQQHAVDRSARPALLQQAEKLLPGGGVCLLVGLLQRVAAGGVDQHRLVGEPPVAVAGAADALDRRLAHLAGQREGQPGIHQRGGLARPRGADEHVPGQLVEVLAALEERPLARRAGTLLEHLQRLGEALAEHLGLAIRRIRARGQLADHRGIGALSTHRAQPDDDGEQRQNHGDRDDPFPYAVERAALAERDQRAYPPDQRGQREQPVDGQRDRVKDGLQDLLHAEAWTGR